MTQLIPPGSAPAPRRRKVKKKTLRLSTDMSDPPWSNLVVSFFFVRKRQGICHSALLLSRALSITPCTRTLSKAGLKFQMTLIHLCVFRLQHRRAYRHWRQHDKSLTMWRCVPSALCPRSSISIPSVTHPPQSSTVTISGCCHVSGTILNRIFL